MLPRNPKMDVSPLIGMKMYRFRASDMICWKEFMGTRVLKLLLSYFFPSSFKFSTNVSVRNKLELFSFSITQRWGFISRIRFLFKRFSFTQECVSNLRQCYYLSDSKLYTVDSINGRAGSGEGLKHKKRWGSRGDILLLLKLLKQILYKIEELISVASTFPTQYSSWRPKI